MTIFRSRKGYIFMVTVLFMGTVSLAVMSTYLLLSITTLQTGSSLERSHQALEYALTCTERTLQSLRDDSGYRGDEEVTLTNGSCTILNVGGSGNENRTICTEGLSGNTTRRIEIIVERLLPTTTIYSWQEVSIITACSY